MSIKKCRSMRHTPAILSRSLQEHDTPPPPIASASRSIPLQVLFEWVNMGEGRAPSAVDRLRRPALQACLAPVPPCVGILIEPHPRQLFKTLFASVMIGDISRA
jgi:hypothetical protein